MDANLFTLINATWAHPALDLTMAAASSWAFWWPFLVLGGLLLLIFGGFRARAMLLACGIALGITDALVVDTLKGIVGRPRPHEAMEGVRTIDLGRANPRFLALAKPLKVRYSGPPKATGHGNSFPSGHAANNFCVAMVAALFYRRWGWLVFLPASLVSYSRIYVGSHWPLDVAVSCVIGVAIALAVVAAMRWLWERHGGRLLPKVFASHPELTGP